MGTKWSVIGALVLCTVSVATQSPPNTKVVKTISIVVNPDRSKCDPMNPANDTASVRCEANSVIDTGWSGNPNGIIFVGAKCKKENGKVYCSCTQELGNIKCALKARPLGIVKSCDPKETLSTPVTALCESPEYFGEAPNFSFSVNLPRIVYGPVLLNSDFQDLSDFLSKVSAEGQWFDLVDREKTGTLTEEGRLACKAVKSNLQDNDHTVALLNACRNLNSQLGPKERLEPGAIITLKEVPCCTQPINTVPILFNDSTPEVSSPPFATPPPPTPTPSAPQRPIEVPKISSPQHR